MQVMTARLVRFLEPFIICENGEVIALLAQRSTAATFSLSTSVPEFPLTWCIAESEVGTICMWRGCVRYCS